MSFKTNKGELVAESRSCLLIGSSALTPARIQDSAVLKVLKGRFGKLQLAGHLQNIF
jgi:hypothetical protein